MPPRARLTAKLAGLAVAAMVLVGCGSNDTLPPAELQSFEPTLELERIWDQSLAGYDEQLLTFTPAVNGDEVFAVDHEGFVAALDKNNGDVRWEVELDLAVSAGLGVDDDQLYLGLFDGRVLALSQQDGSEVWQARVSSEVLAAPQSRAGLVVVQTIDGKIFGLDASSGQQRWVYSRAQPALSLRGTATPLVTTDITFAGFASGDVVALSNTNGGVIWERKVGVPAGRTELERLVDIDGGFVLDDGVLYSVGYQGQLVALDPATGRDAWAKPVSSLRQPVTGYSNVYVATAEGDVMAYSLQNQAVVWRQEGLQRRALGGLSAFNGALVVGDFEGYVHFLSMVDGKFMARIRPDSDGVRATPLVDQDKVYILGNGGELSAWRVREANN